MQEKILRKKIKTYFLIDNKNEELKTATYLSCRIPFKSARKHRTRKSKNSGLGTPPFVERAVGGGPVEPLALANCGNVTIGSGASQATLWRMSNGRLAPPLS